MYEGVKFRGQECLEYRVTAIWGPQEFLVIMQGVNYLSRGIFGLDQGLAIFKTRFVDNSSSFLRDHSL